MLKSRLQVLLAALIPVPLIIMVAMTQFPPGDLSKEPVDLGQSISSTPKVVNSKVQAFAGQKQIKGVNDKQLMLAGKTFAVDGFKYQMWNKPKHDIKLFVNLSDQFGCDMINVNNKLFTYMMETGEASFTVTPIVDRTALSIFAAEAVAEVSTTDPEHSWEFLHRICVQRGAIEKDSTEAEVADWLMKQYDFVNDNPAVKDRMTKESILNGSFTSWLISFANNSKKETSVIPSISKDGHVLDSASISLSDTDAVAKLIRDSKGAK